MKKAHPDIYGEKSQIHNYWQNGDFLDAYEVRLDDADQKLSAHELAQKLMAKPPAMFRPVLTLRNWIVRPFGLKAPQDIEKDTPRIGFFPIEHETPDEIVLGGDDKHLDFRIFLTKQGDKAIFGTWVHTHNKFGRVYLFTISPFHHYISKYWQQEFSTSREPNA